MNTEYRIIPYTAISVSIVARLIFMYLLYTNKSRNSLSLLFCVMNVGSSSMWIWYGVVSRDTPLMVRSSAEMGLLLTSAIYILRNKWMDKWANAGIPTQLPETK